MSTETREALVERLEEIAGVLRYLEVEAHKYGRGEEARDRGQQVAAVREAARLMREDGERGGAGAQEALAKIDAADEMVRALCKVRGEPGAREWVMSIPARPDYDPDLVIGDALRAARKAIEGADESDDLTAAYLAGRYDRRRDRPDAEAEAAFAAARAKRVRPVAPSRAALSNLYLEAHRAGVEAAADYMGEVGRPDMWAEIMAVRNELTAEIREALEDDHYWTAPGSPLARALAHPEVGEEDARGGSAHEGNDMVAAGIVPDSARRAHPDAIAWVVEMVYRGQVQDRAVTLNRQYGEVHAPKQWAGDKDWSNRITPLFARPAAGGEERERAAEEPDGAALIAAERRRQMEVEGWTPEHDDTHHGGSLALAAACYAIPAAHRETGVGGAWGVVKIKLIRALWLWDTAWWKPSPEDRIRELVKAGALAAAEIDRLKRLAALRGEEVGDG